MTFLLLALLIVQVFFSFFEQTTGFGCRDENNQLVDWYYLYKLPEVNSFEGLEYVYITSNSNEVSWTQSKLKVSDPNSIPGRTISQLYEEKNDDDNVVLMYNDEPPSASTDMLRGHTKGVVASDQRTGFWLIHSVPHFPPTLDAGVYDYPHTGRRYAQSFLCITMNSDQINKAGLSLLYNEPVIYSSRAPDQLSDTFPNLYKVIQNMTIQDGSFAHIDTLVSIDQTTFKTFAKARHFNKDLYEDLVAPSIGMDLYVETWQHGTGNLPSNCSSIEKVYNIEKVNIEVADCEFTTMHDHSKWAVTTDDNWICVGDINRQEHQKVRGGGTICQRDSKIADAYQKLVSEIQPCPKRSVFMSVLLKFQETF